MVLSKEIPYVTDKMRELSSTHDLMGYVEDVRKSGDYKSLKIRVANDLIKAACGTAYLCGLYDKYGCNDSHITTLAIKCMGNIGIVL